MLSIEHLDDGWKTPLMLLYRIDILYDWPFQQMKGLIKEVVCKI